MITLPLKSNIQITFFITCFLLALLALYPHQAQAAAEGKVTICHATGSAKNPYVGISVAASGLNGHGDHAGDILRPTHDLDGTLLCREDTTGPEVILPVTALEPTEATSSAGAQVTYSVTATDNGSSVSVVCIPPSGSTFAIGTTLVTCTSTDARGNITIKTFEITVADKVAPELSVPLQGLTLQLGVDQQAAVLDISSIVKATDTGDSNVAISCNPADGSSLAAGVHEVTCTATDNSGNATASTFTVTVAPDTTPPDAFTINTPSGSGHRGTVTINWTTTINTHHLVATCSVVVDGVVVAEGLPGDTSSYDLVGLSPGTHQVEIIQYDAAGNATTSAVAVEVFSDLPVAPSTPTLTGDVTTDVAGNAVFEGTAQNPTPTISWPAPADSTPETQYQVFVNGVKVATVTGALSYGINEGDLLLNMMNTVDIYIIDPCTCSNYQLIKVSSTSFIFHSAPDLTPSVVILSQPTSGTTSTTATITFEASNAHWLECQVDVGGFVPCSGSVTYTNLPGGTRTVTVRATSIDGQVAEAVATWYLQPTAACTGRVCAIVTV